MFKTPDIPTDNLYKFISIFGLAIFSLSIYILVNNQQSFENSINNSNISHSKILLEKSQNDSKRIILDEKIEMRRIKIKVNYGIENTLKISESEYSKINNKEDFERDYEKLKEFELDNLLLGDTAFHTEKNLKKNQENIKVYTAIPILILSIIGIVLMVVGFSLWYYRTQKHYDKELRQ
ncbi:hypothetical protein HHL23_00160 [Chryseobacterium sp. RP-3-3]|uniref:Uncharacterized protein n=1 Tax=Chryseobacterium antibioticum TaxID=2728847 RepID=A0A7Y0AJ04_9FLAO|nr:hypothetical protein [Chryseobacterium antibioticum]NML68226.1 hypothetical protein [Chryseobacterium antibioticum]